VLYRVTPVPVSPAHQLLRDQPIAPDVCCGWVLRRHKDAILQMRSERLKSPQHVAVGFGANASVAHQWQ
jgi:hypothetical protein